jgi:DNA-binding LytR/AlgR family response regulator
MASEKLFEVESVRKIEKLFLYQSDIYYLERGIDSINIFTNDGRIIEIKGKFEIIEKQLK